VSTVADRCPQCGQARPEPTGPHVVGGVLVEPIVAPFAPGVEFWRAKGRPELPLATTPAQAAQLARITPPPGGAAA
jgi:hypothetical protein